MHINWNYTYKCNFNCKHCYSRTRKDIEELSTHDKLCIAENIVRNKVFNVNLGGGEPLLCEDCTTIIKYLSDRHINVNLSTNGWKIERTQIIELQKAGLSGVSISLDHIKPEIHDEVRNVKGSWLEAIDSIKKIRREGIKVYLSTVITSLNFPYLEDILCLAESLDVYGVDLKRLKRAGNAVQKSYLEITDIQRDELYYNIPIWKNKYKININLVYSPNRIENIDAGCPCGKTSIAILCNGDIAPCVYNTSVIGNALRDDIHDVWCYSKELNYLRENFSCLGLMKK